MGDSRDHGVPGSTAPAEDAWWDAVYGPEGRDATHHASTGTVDDWFATALGAIGAPDADGGADLPPTPQPRTAPDSLPRPPRVPDPRVLAPRVGSVPPTERDPEIDLDLYGDPALDAPVSRPTPPRAPSAATAALADLFGMARDEPAAPADDTAPPSADSAGWFAPPAPTAAAQGAVPPPEPGAGVGEPTTPPAPDPTGQPPTGPTQTLDLRTDAPSAPHDADAVIDAGGPERGGVSAQAPAVPGGSPTERDGRPGADAWPPVPGGRPVGGPASEPEPEREPMPPTAPGAAGPAATGRVAGADMSGPERGDMSADAWPPSPGGRPAGAPAPAPEPEPEPEPVPPTAPGAAGPAATGREGRAGVDGTAAARAADAGAPPAASAFPPPADQLGRSGAAGPNPATAAAPKGRLGPQVPTPTLPDGAALRWGRGRPSVVAGLPEPDALPEADPEDLGALVPDTVMELARHGSMTLRAASARGEEARALGAPRGDRLVVARFGEGADGLLVAVIASGRGAGEASRLLAEAVGRSRAGLLADLRQGAQEQLRYGLQRLTARAARVSGPEGAVHAVLAPLDPTNRLRAGFGTGPGSLLLLGDDAWYDAYAGRRLTAQQEAPPEVVAAEQGRFRFRAVVPESCDVLLLCTDGLAAPLRAEPAVAALLAEHWSQPHAPGGVDFLRQIQSRASGHSDDRTAVAIWED